jgi:hypothetical protein
MNKIRINGAISFIIILMCFFIQAARSSDWMFVVSPTPQYAPAWWIKANFGGSGLGITPWDSYTVTTNAQASATNCCNNTNTCWCGNITQMVCNKSTCRQFIANTTNAYSVGGQTAAITQDTQNDVLSHEATHVQIHIAISQKENSYVSSNFQTIQVNKRSDQKTAINAALFLAKIFNSNCSVELTTLNDTYNNNRTGLDSCEYAYVINGVWREPACNRSKLIFDPISQISPQATLPQDQPGDCQ